MEQAEDIKLNFYIGPDQHSTTVLKLPKTNRTIEFFFLKTDRNCKSGIDYFFRPCINDQRLFARRTRCYVTNRLRGEFVDELRCLVRGKRGCVGAEITMSSLLNHRSARGREWAFRCLHRSLHFSQFSLERPGGGRDGLSYSSRLLTQSN